MITPIRINAGKEEATATIMLIGIPFWDSVDLVGE